MAKKGGRPTSYKAEYARQAYRLCLLGATDRDLAEFFRVSEVTINAWKKKEPRFLKSLNEGKTAADAKVAESLYMRALGYSHRAVKIFISRLTGEPIIVPYVEHYPPDSTAAIFWLKNRRPQEWRDKQDVDHTGEVKLIVNYVDTGSDGPRDPD